MARSRLRPRWLAVPAAIAATATLIAPPAVADDASYDEVRDVTAETAELRAVHHHDWSEATSRKRWKMISSHHDPFRADNDYASLEVTDRKTGRRLFRAPVPALTRLWISPDSRHILGLSEIMVWNPYQLVLYDRDGHLLFRRHIASEEAVFTPREYEQLLFRFPKAKSEIERLTTREGDRVFVDLGDPHRLHGAWDTLYRHLHRSHYSTHFSETVTNFVYWLDPRDPRPQLIESDGHVTAVELSDPEGVRFRIPVPVPVR
jgi:hypothetical protein